MKDELFDELISSVREGGAILRGEAKPARSFDLSASASEVAAAPDVRQIRDSYGLSQADFATLLGISAATLRNWEQGRRAPEGPARVLLRVAATHPDAVWDVVRPQRDQMPARTRRKTKLSTAKAMKLKKKV